MKKLIFSMLLVLMLATSVWAVGSSMTVSSDSLIWSRALNRPVFRVITVIFTADDTTGAIPDLTLNAATAGLTQGSPFGWFGYAVIIDCNHTGIEPTENSELYILNAGGGDVLGGQGVDQIDNTAERFVYFHNGSVPFKQPMVGAWTVRVTQQAVATNSATGTIQIILTAD